LDDFCFSPAATTIANHIPQTQITSYSASYRLPSGTCLEFPFDRRTESYSRLQTDVFWETRPGFAVSVPYVRARQNTLDAKLLRSLARPSGIEAVFPPCYSMSPKTGAFGKDHAQNWTFRPCSWPGRWQPVNSAAHDWPPWGLAYL